MINSDYTGVVDYDARDRNLRLENDRAFMISSLLTVISSLEKISENPEILTNKIQIRSNEGIGQENSPLSESNILRELQFLISHTVHHYALIGLILETLGFKPDESFGVAPSTLKYELNKRSKSIAS